MLEGSYGVARVGVEGFRGFGIWEDDGKATARGLAWRVVFPKP